MSQQLGRALQAWQAVRATLERKSVCWRGNPLSDRDRGTYTEAIVLCCLHLTDMSSRFDGIGTYRELVAWAHMMCTLDVQTVGSFLSDAVTALRHVSEPTTLCRFKRLLSEEYPFTGDFFNPIKGVLQKFLEDPMPETFRPCYQFLSFLTHLSLEDLAIDLEGEYKELEAYLRAQSPPPKYVSEMNQIMREWMADFEVTPESFIPRHGPGGTAELPRSAFTLDKYAYLGTDPMIEYVFGKHAGFDVRSFYPLPVYQHWTRESRIVFVKKSMKTRRVISAEPATLQYLQQGINRILDEYIHSHPVLRRHINLHNQEVGGAMAIAGSGGQGWSTIDLSSASDTVTTDLVKNVFRGTPVLPFLLALRSRTVRLPSGERMEIAKYAPMGSALCFPVETLIFACAVELTIRRAHRFGLSSRTRPFNVYGDDIIVPDDLFDEVLATLHSLGFIANASKSFGPGARFRESCGHDGYGGVDVTPLRISRGFATSPDRWDSSHAAHYMGLIDFANSAGSYDFRLLRAWIIGVLLRYPTAPPLFAEEGRGCLWSPVPDNYRASSRLNKRLQRVEINVVGTVNRPGKGRTPQTGEEVRYWETLRLSHTRHGDMFSPEHLISVPSGPLVSVLSTGWVNNPRSTMTIAEQKSVFGDTSGGEGKLGE